jgi:hypothetical protein
MQTIGQFLEQTLDTYTKHFGSFVKISLWFGIAVLLSLIAGFMSQDYSVLFFWQEIPSPLETAGAILQLLTILIVAPIIGLWVQAGIILHLRDMDSGQTDHLATMADAWRYVPGLIFLSIAYAAIMITAFSLILFVGSIPILLRWLVNAPEFFGAFGAFTLLVSIIFAVVAVIYLAATIGLAQVAYLSSGSPKRPLSYLKLSFTAARKKVFGIIVRLGLILFFTLIPVILFETVAFELLSSFLTLFDGAPSLLARLAELLDGIVTLISSIIFTPPLAIGTYFIWRDVIKKTPATTERLQQS